MLFAMMFALGAATSGGISAIGFSDRQWQWLDLPLPPSGTLVQKMFANPSMKADTSGLWLPRVSGASVASTWYPSHTHARSIKSKAVNLLACCKMLQTCQKLGVTVGSNQISGARITHVQLYVRFFLHQWLCYVASIFCLLYSRVLFLSQIERPSSVL